VARAHGLPDGATAAGDSSLERARRLTEALGVPLSVDVVSGYSATPADVVVTGLAFQSAGVVGVIVEDGQPDRARPIAEVALHCDRIAALRQAGRGMHVPLFINARTDVFWLAVGPPRGRLTVALRRAEAYLAAGADGIFIPGLVDAALIRDAARAISAPLNLLAGPDTPPVHVLQELGVKRLSLGSGPMRATLGLLKDIAAELQGTGTYRYLDRAMPYGAANAL
jgi:2-methylisocitrate lyase-like PEP mutase family enzyme